MILREMTDAALVEAVATEGMGGELMHGDRWFLPDGRVIFRVGPSAWNPLTDANARDEVVEWFVSRGWLFAMEEYEIGALRVVSAIITAEDGGAQGASEAGTRGRAVCEAALEAVRRGVSR